jgi:phytoene/squalene synthetase
MQQQLYDTVSAACSKQVTRHYSTSFTLGINLLSRKMHDPVYSIYGFVRLADEIVDTFHTHHPAKLLADFRAETEAAIANKFSVNPILHAFQAVVHRYRIDAETIELFLESMESDLHAQVHEK